MHYTISKIVEYTTFIGNMSNPLINRWGFNLFWYNFWYTDKNNFLQNTFDDVISKLLLLYVNYGLLFNKNIFFSAYWYKKTSRCGTNLFKRLDAQYFRAMSHKNRITGELSRFYVRFKKKDVYFGKVWILRYQGWIITNIAAFQPVKKKKQKIKNRKFLSVFLKQSDAFFQNQFLLLFRYKLYFLFIKNEHMIKKNLYYFF